MDEMLSGAQEGAIKAMQLKQSQQDLKSHDQLFVQACHIYASHLIHASYLVHASYLNVPLPCVLLNPAEAASHCNLQIAICVHTR